MLTQLAKSKLDAVTAEACEAQFKLESSPLTTAELANFHTFLDEIQERVRHMSYSYIVTRTTFLFSTYLFLTALIALYSSPVFSQSYQITALEKEQETICQMYDLINMYSVPLPPDDLVAFSTLHPSINSLHDLIHEAVAERKSSMDRFCTSLHKDIVELNHEVTKIKLKSQVHEEFVFPLLHSVHSCRLIKIKGSTIWLTLRP